MNTSTHREKHEETLLAEPDGLFFFLLKVLSSLFAIPHVTFIAALSKDSRRGSDPAEGVWRSRGG